ncbi:Uncharacterised protein [Mycolicibacterium fortuitum]|uniref:Uncharacterized protein n=1 Tax=Mycolicibacterium fortuitum TaxID=1766 RepID=A0A378V0Z8_MYCFO|nr:Uncharacterised protein [Mycolicibacterium fortuitum]
MVVDVGDVSEVDVSEVSEVDVSEVSEDDVVEVSDGPPNSVVIGRRLVVVRVVVDFVVFDVDV